MLTPAISGVTGAALVPHDIVRYTHETIIRLADEGVPTRAIARITKFDCDGIREILQEALDDGTILQLPREDWPVGSTRAERVPGAIILAVNDDAALLHLRQLFSLTGLEGTLLLALIKRRECTREALHQAIEQRRADEKEPTSQKMVDVLICKLRKKLEPHAIRIKTMWACGYYMMPDDRRKADQMLRQWIARHDVPEIKPNFAN